MQHGAQPSRTPNRGMPAPTPRHSTDMAVAAVQAGYTPKKLQEVDMGKGLRLVNDIWEAIKENRPKMPPEAYLGVVATLELLSNPTAQNLWDRLKAYLEE